MIADVFGLQKLTFTNLFNSFAAMRNVDYIVVGCGLASISFCEVLKANQVLLEQSVESQKQVIAQQKQDFDDILKANKDLQKIFFDKKQNSSREALKKNWENR